MKTKIWKVWIGGGEIPEHFKQYTDTWSKISNAEVIEVTDANVKEWTGKTSYELADHFKGNKQVANHWVRYFLMYYYGGIYLDLDVEVIKDSMVWSHSSATFGFESKEWVNNHVMISYVKENNIFYDLYDFTWRHFNKLIKPEIDTGPGLVSSLDFKQYHVVIMPTEVFSPWNWNEKPDRTRITENTLAVHHFAHSWKK
jgi:mannosyltransferase OCH1-like enzyme